MLGAAVIGLGVGRHHCEGYAKSSDAKLLAVCDLLEDRLRLAKDRYGVNVYKDYHELLKREDIDVVSLCTPDFTHVKIGVEVLEAGKHLLLEKPMALKLEDCDRIMRAAEKNDRKLGVGFEMRINPLSRGVKKLIDDGTVGEVASVSISLWRVTFWPKPGRWIQQRRYAGSMIIEEGCHWFDLARWYGGEISQVYAVGSGVRKDFDFEQTVHTGIKFTSGAVGQISQSILGFHSRWTAWVTGSRSSVYAELANPPPGFIAKISTKEHRDDLMADHEKGLVKTLSLGDQAREASAVALNVQNFLRCISENQEPLATGLDGRKALELCLAADLSIYTGEIVNLPLRRTPDFIAEKIASPDYPYLSLP